MQWVHRQATRELVQSSTHQVKVRAMLRCTMKMVQASVHPVKVRAMMISATMMVQATSNQVQVRPRLNYTASRLVSGDYVSTHGLV